MRSLSTSFVSAAALFLPFAASAQGQAETTATEAGMGLLALLMLLLVVGLGLALFIFWVMMLIDCVHREWPAKTTWLVLLVVSLLFGLHWIVALVYFFTIKKKNVGAMAPKSPTNPPTPPAPPTTI